MRFTGFASLLVIAVMLLSAYGWINNIYNLVAKDDFNAPYKAEVLRLAGVPIAPLGVILGFVEFDEEKNK